MWFEIILALYHERHACVSDGAHAGDWHANGHWGQRDTHPWSISDRSGGSLRGRRIVRFLGRRLGRPARVVATRLGRPHLNLDGAFGDSLFDGRGAVLWLLSRLAGEPAGSDRRTSIRIAPSTNRGDIKESWPNRLTTLTASRNELWRRPRAEVSG